MATQKLSIIHAFSPRELRIVEDAEAYAHAHQSAYETPLREGVEALRSVAWSIGQYPSILSTGYLGVRVRHATTLVESLCRSAEEDWELLTPTRAILGRALLTAKVQYYNLIRDMYIAPLPSGENPERGVQRSEVTTLIYTTIFALLIEEVLMSIMEDEATPDLNQPAARFLVSIWERRMSVGVDQLAPILTTMWHSRSRLRPIYGTLMGTAELSSLSRNAHSTWFEFLDRTITDPRVASSLEEFLFDLTYEELSRVRREMARRGVSSVDRGDITTILGRKRGATAVEPNAPRWIYSFYQRRRTNARFRREAELPGPHKAIEEYLIAFLLRDGIIQAETKPPGAISRIVDF